MDLSVIIPCHDVADTLDAQLDALALQDWDGEWEIIVVDNNSSDDTAAIARRHRSTTERLRVIPAHDGTGVAFARRKGVEASAAMAVAFCDGDDVVADGWVAAMGDALRHNGAVSGAIDVTLLNTPDVRASRGSTDPTSAPMYGGVVFLRGNNCGMHRALWDRFGGFDESFRGLEDIELSLRLAAAGVNVVFAPEAVVHYRYRSTAHGLWRQGLFYGRSYPFLDRIGRRAGLPMPARLRGARSWAWLVLHLPVACRRNTRYRWVWTLACRVGALRSAVLLTLRPRSARP